MVGGFTNFSRTAIFHVGQSKNDKEMHTCPQFPSVPEGLRDSDGIVLGDELILCTAPDGKCVTYNQAGNSWADNPRNSGNSGSNSRSKGVLANSKEWWVTGE